MCRFCESKEPIEISWHDNQLTHIMFNPNTCCVGLEPIDKDNVYVSYYDWQNGCYEPEELLKNGISAKDFFKNEATIKFNYCPMCGKKLTP